MPPSGILGDYFSHLCLFRQFERYPCHQANDVIPRCCFGITRCSGNGLTDNRPKPRFRGPSAPFFDVWTVSWRPIRAIEVGLLLVVHQTLLEMAGTDLVAEAELVKTLGLGREFRFRRLHLYCQTALQALLVVTCRDSWSDPLKTTDSRVTP